MLIMAFNATEECYKCQRGDDRNNPLLVGVNVAVFQTTHDESLHYFAEDICAMEHSSMYKISTDSRICCLYGGR